MGGTVSYAGSGLYEITIDGGGTAITIPAGAINLWGMYCEHKHADTAGCVSIAGADGVNIDGFLGDDTGGAAMIDISETTNGAVRAVTLKNIRNYSSFTNTVRDNINSDSITESFVPLYVFTSKYWNDTSSRLGNARLQPTTFANLGTSPSGTLKVCTDCKVISPCAGGGSGALAVRIGSTWACK